MTLDIPLSILDRSVRSSGGAAGEALRGTVALAGAAESWGYRRFWVSEHHSVPGIAGSAPTVLAAAIGQATRQIRVGTGGVMLPNHRPFVVAEQFGTLAALFGDRIDMGLGRSLGFTPAVRGALGAETQDAARFETDVTELLGFIAGDQTAHPGVRARPGEGRDIPAFVLAVASGAKAAARLGLPVVVPPNDELIAAYRDEFRSRHGSRPYVVVATQVAVAETSEAARALLLSEAWATALSRTRGEFPSLLPPQEVEETPKTSRQQAYMDKALSRAVWGDETEAREQLSRLIARTGADELMATTGAWDRAALHDSHRRLAGL